MRLRKLVIHLKSSLWLIPVLCVLAGAALSFATIAVDRYFDYQNKCPAWQWLAGTGRTPVRAGC